MLATREKFEQARALEAGFHILPDVGDVMGALVASDAGFEAIGTTSVGLGFAHGCPSTHAVDGNAMLASVHAICSAVNVPVFVDFEQGYAETTAGVGDMARAVFLAGAVGFNIEDSNGIPGAPLRAAQEHAERIAACRAAADALGIPALITGRTDTFWLNGDLPAQERLDEAVRRAKLYLEAGADSIFISGRKGLSPQVLGELIARIDGQFNSLLSQDGPSPAEHRALGVHRLQTGSLAARAQNGLARQAFAALRENLDPALFDRFAMPTPTLNALAAPYWKSFNP